MKKDLLNSPTDGSMQGSGAMSQYSAPASHNSRSADMRYNTYDSSTYQAPAKKNCGCNDRQNAGTGTNPLNSSSDIQQQTAYGNNAPYPQSVPYSTQATYSPSGAQLPFSNLPQSVLPSAKMQSMSSAGIGAAAMWQQLSQDTLYPNNQ